MSLGFHPEDVLLWSALATGVAGFLAAAFYARGQGAHHWDRAQKLVQLSASFLAVNLLLMVYDFITLQLRIEYVHAYTNLALPLAYRISGLWGGQKGTILMWGTFSALLLVAHQAAWARQARRGAAPPDDPRGARTWTFLFALAIVLAFTLLMILQDTWARTDAYLLSLKPEGFGLQPVLRTPFMVIHPPLQFLGYALATLLFAGGLAYLVTGHRHWADLVLPWTRLAFLIQFVGLGLGGLWAYYVLNFAGYWAWDPVETANLIAFFPTLLLLHSLLFYRKGNMFQSTAPLFALLTFPATLFSTIATRSGLWVSVHAFTDPSQNFARDPFTRFLNILDASGVGLSFLTGLFLAALATAVLVYLVRLVRTPGVRGSPRRWAQRAALLGFFLLSSFLVLSLLDPRYGVSLLFEASRFLYPANAPLGLAILLVGATVLLASPTFFAPEEERARPGGLLDRWVNTANLVFVGMLFVSLALLVTFLLDVLSINGYQRSVYDVRAPLIATPILLTMGVALAQPTWGKRRTLWIAAATLLAGIALALAARSRWEPLLVLPPLLFALAATCVKLFKVSDPGPKAPASLRLAGALLLFGGIAALFYWANPPTRIPLPGLTLYPSAWWAAAGIPASLLSVVGGVSTLRSHNLRLARLGAAALAASLAWIVGPLLALTSLVLIHRHRARFEAGRAAWDVGATRRSLERQLRKSGVYLVHVCLVLGLMGYTASTYLRPADETILVALGQPQASHGYEFSLTGTTEGPLDREQRILKDLTAHVEVARDGRDLGDAPITMWLELRQHYAERVRVERFAAEDLYLGGAVGQFQPVRFTVRQGDQELTFNAHDDGIQLRPGAQVVSVFFTVRTLPGMHLVWGGLWGVGCGLLFILASGGFRFETRTERVASGRERPPLKPSATTIK